MTSGEFFALMLKRWYVLLLGIGLTLMVAWSMGHRPGVYWSQVNVVLLSPTSQDFPNELEDPPYALAPLASLIVADFNGVDRPLLTAASDTTLYGEGEREGVLVRMPNHGNQWRPLYTTPTIDVQVVDSSPEAVSNEVDNVISELDQLLTERQNALGVDQFSRATIIASPTDPPIYYVSGSRARTFGAIGAAGLATTIAAVCGLEWVLTRRRLNSSIRQLAGVLDDAPSKT